MRWAQALTALVGEPLEVAELPRRFGVRARGVVGKHLRSVETWGKHLLLNLSDGQTIHCHALMYGSWQVGKAGMRLWKDPRYVRLRLRTAAHEAAFFHGPVVELLTPEERKSHPRLRTLGPDLMSPGFDRDVAWRRLQKRGTREVGDAVMDQRIVAGIGNIYKSEGLFLAEIDPRRRTDNVSRQDIERLWDVVIPLMWQGAKTHGPITTLPESLRKGGERNWVYRRRGRPCFRCGVDITLFHQGQLRRATYVCPACQL